MGVQLFACCACFLTRVPSCLVAAVQVSPSKGGPRALCRDTARGAHPAALHQAGAAGGGGGGGLRAHVPAAVALCLRARSSQVRSGFLSSADVEFLVVVVNVVCCSYCFQ